MSSVDAEGVKLL